jgi:hypothetical protein
MNMNEHPASVTPSLHGPSARVVGLSEFTAGRRLAVYGAGFAFHQMRKLLPDLAPDLIIDDQYGQAAADALVVPVLSQESLGSISPDDWCVLICAYVSTSVQAIRNRLAAHGFHFPKDALDLSVLHWYTMAPRLREELGIPTDDDLFWSIHALAMGLPISNATTIAGTSLAVHIIQSLTARCEGDIAEFGAYEGANALITSTLLHRALRGRRYFLFDSFEGLQPGSPHDPKERAGEFADLSWDAVRSRFAAIAPIRICKGYFADTLAHAGIDRLCVAYIDCDLYEPAVECLAFAAQRLEPQGAILVHDYVPPDWHYPDYVKQPFRGIAEAVRKCIGEQFRAIYFPETTHMVLVHSRQK